MEIEGFVINRSYITLLLLHITTQMLVFNAHHTIMYNNLLHIGTMVNVCQNLWFRRCIAQPRLYICYSTFVWCLFLGSLFLLHIAVQDIKVLTHIASSKSSFCCISQLSTFILMHIVIAKRGLCCKSQIRQIKEVQRATKCPLLVLHFI